MHKKIAELWVDRITKGERTFEEVPVKLKDEVKQILDERGVKY